MCSGRVDLEFVLKAFLNGMDGVFIGGCRLDECNYMTHGNYDALNMVLLCKKLMESTGINPERVTIEFMSSGEGNLFAETVDRFSEKIRGLGPLGTEREVNGSELTEKIADMIKLVPYIKMVKKEKLAARLRDQSEYEAFFTAGEIAEMFRQVPAYYINPDKCKACMICLRRCPVDAVEGGKNRVHVIDQDKCIKCGTCLDVCPPRFQAVETFTGEPAPPPIPEAERTITRKQKEK